MVIEYWLATDQTEPARITILDASGTTVTSLEASGRAGLNCVVWPLRDSRRMDASPGAFEVVLDANGVRVTRSARVKPLSPCRGADGRPAAATRSWRCRPVTLARTADRGQL